MDHKTICSLGWCRCTQPADDWSIPDDVLRHMSTVDTEDQWDADDDVLRHMSSVDTEDQWDADDDVLRHMENVNVVDEPRHVEKPVVHWRLGKKRQVSKVRHLVGYGTPNDRPLWTTNSHYDSGSDTSVESVLDDDRVIPPSPNSTSESTPVKTTCPPTETAPGTSEISDSDDSVIPPTPESEMKSGTTDTSDSNRRATKQRQCLMCGLTLASEKSLRNHVAYKHALERRQFTCPVCHVALKRKDTLRCHMRTHSGEKPYQCPECDKQFAYKSNAKRHLASHMNHSAPKKFRCTECRVTKSTYKDMMTHLWSHLD